MFARSLAAALAAGILAGILSSVIQSVTTTPLILLAEAYESAAATTVMEGAMHRRGGRGEVPVRLARGDPASNAAEHVEGGEPSWQPAEGMERSFFTLLSNLIAGIAFAALLIAAFGLSRARITARSGVVWGLAGFAVFAAAPALGLPPEVPGAGGGEMGARQAWWAFVAVSTAIGLWLLVLGRGVLRHAAGVLLLALPHWIGAPQADLTLASVPPELAAQYAAASLVTSLIFWSMLGWLAGSFFERLVLVPQKGA